MTDTFVENLVCDVTSSFFFSSRRRHTRFDCDWSSDVCSSDLAAAERLNELVRQLENSIEKLAQQAEGLSREGERAAAAHAERNTEAVKLNEQIDRKSVV